MAKKKKPLKSKKTKPAPSKKTASKAKARKVVAEIVDDTQTPNFKETTTNVEPFDALDSINPIELETDNAILVPVATANNLKSTDPLTTYLNEIRKYPVLNREEELVLAKKYYETRDPEAAQALVRANLRFVVKIAAEYARFSSRMIDLIQEGNVGLMHAVKEFNPEKGTRLITYAVWWIRGYIQEYLMRQFSMVRIGTTANQRKLFYQLQKQKAELEKMSNPEKIQQLSHKLGIPADEVEEMAKRLTGRDVSIDKTSDDDSNNLSLSNILKKDDGSLPLDEQLALAEQLAYLKDAIEQVRPSLNDKEKIILEERVLNDEPLTLQEIGEKYKITREAVRQNEARLINKIKEALSTIMNKKP